MTASEFIAHLAGLLASESAWALLCWWAALALLGLAFLPVSRRLFGHGVDAGYAAGKLLGLLVASHVAWLAGFLGLGVLSAAALTASGVALCAVIALTVWQADRVETRVPPWRAIVASEGGFLICLLAFAVVRSLEPTLATTEKFMDYGFVNGILNASSLPPPDPWYAGETINYYYFGHFITAFWIRLTGVPASIGYNLMVATLFAATASAAATLATDAVRLRFAHPATPSTRALALLAGLTTALLLVAGGNLHPALFGSDAGYHYSEATRFIGFAPETNDKLITEFPAFSFVLADLHAHLVNLPFTLVSLHVLLALFHDERTPKRGPRLAGLPLPLLLTSGFLIGTFWMTNSWDAPLHAGLLGLTLWLRPDPQLGVGARFLRSGLVTAGALALAALVCLPFTIHFEPFGRGIAWVTSRTPLAALAILYGWQITAALVYASSGRAKGLPDPLDRWLFALIAGAAVCIATHEIIHVEDGLPADYLRANTVFKLGFQAFVLLTVCVGPMLAASLAARSRRPARLALAAIAALLVLPALRFLPIALPELMRSSLRDRPTLDGLDQIYARNAEDAAIAGWLDVHGRGQGNLLESYGESFGYGARMAVFTGIPDVLGWISHEALWRPGEPVNLRRQAVITAYTSGDTHRVRGTLERYDVGFVVVGELERLVFEGLDEAPFRELGEVVLEVGDSRLYRIHRAGASR